MGQPDLEVLIDQKRFWDKVEKGPGCWIWKNCKTGAGYGQIYLNGRIEYSHRLAWILCVGPIPNGLFVLHSCDNPPCCRPDHLFLGTPKDNSVDAAQKGRLVCPVGAEHVNAKLTDDQVRQARERAAFGESQRAIARSYGVDHTVILDVIQRTAWAHVQ